MKIGILTQPLLNNYGGLLQNYALQHALKDLGHEPVTIDHGEKKQNCLRKELVQIKNYLGYWLQPSRYDAPRYQPNKKEFEIISRNSIDFINNNISKVSPFDTEQKLQQIIREGQYNCYIVGSDQVWRPLYSGGFLKEMFLSFVENKKKIRRIAYAASFGTDKWEFNPQMTEECSRLAKLFDVVTVREKSGITLCKKYFDVDAIHVLDPTMLLYKEDYIRLVEVKKEPQSPGDLFYYILDPSEKKTNLINNIATSKNFIPFTVLPQKQAENRTRFDVKHNIENCVYPAVTLWLRAFMDAKMVVVDSFHGAVFSIIFNRPFWVIGNSKRGNARFESLLELFGLEERMISLDNCFGLDWNKTINWEKVNQIMEKEKRRCINLLDQALK